MRRLPLAIGLVLLQAATLAAGAQTETSRTNTQTQPAEPLAGPAIEPAETDTLVLYEYGGRLQDLGLPPAEAALELLDLDPIAAERIGQVLADRAALAKQLIIDNFDLVSQAETVEDSDNKLEKGLFFVRALRALHPLVERGPLEDEIRELLPDNAAEHFDALLDEYWAAVGQARVDEAATRGQKLRLRKAVRQARQDQLGKEVEQAAQRALESERFVIDHLTRDLELTDSQEARIKDLILAFAARTAGDASEQDKERLFAEVIAYLNEQQRDLIIRRIMGP